MHRVRFNRLAQFTVTIGASGLLAVACNETATSPFAAPEATGGIMETVGGNTGTAEGGATSNPSQGGSSQSTSQSQATGGQSNNSAGGATNSSSSSSSTGGNREAGGNSSSSTGGKATGGNSSSSSTATGGKATGGSSSSNSTATGGKATGGSSNNSTATGGQATGGATSNPGTGGGNNSSSCSTTEETNFSVFLTSKKALQELSGSNDGFGGDLGGITGADEICQKIAEKSAPCHKGTVTWHAFLSTPSVNAKDRIGTGPWYDRRGRLLSANLTNLLQERPSDADASIKNDFPNEDGVPNHAPEGTQVDNHEILTGTGTDGNIYTQQAGGGGPVMPGGSTSCGPNNETWTKEAATCWGWTTKEGKGCPRVGHSWPRDMSGRHWISVWNEGGCAPGGVDTDDGPSGGGLDGTPRVGSAGGYGGFYCFAVTGN